MDTSRSALRILTKLIPAISIMVALPQAATAQAPTRPLTVVELPNAMNATAARLGGDVRMSLNSCKEGRIGEQICYFSLSNGVTVKAESSASSPSLNAIEVELPPDKENTKKLYRTGFLLAHALVPNLSDAEFAALKSALIKALENIFGDTSHQLRNVEFSLRLGVDEPRPWWKRLFSEEPKSKLLILTHYPD